MGQLSPAKRERERHPRLHDHKLSLKAAALAGYRLTDQVFDFGRVATSRLEPFFVNVFF